MTFDYQSCVSQLRTELLNALVGARSFFDALPLPKRGPKDVSGLSLDLFLQHGYVGLSLRNGKEKWDDTDIADWKRALFMSSHDGPYKKQMQGLAAVAKQFYRPQEDIVVDQDIRHMIFLAGAEALLHRDVASLLQSYSVDAPEYGAHLGGHPFTFFVYDPDGALTANYCDIVRANSVTTRIINASSG